MRATRVGLAAALHAACWRGLTAGAVVEHELREERVELVVLHERVLVQTKHLEHERQLLLQQEVGVERPARLLPLFTLLAHVLLEPSRHNSVTCDVS